MPVTRASEAVRQWLGQRTEDDPRSQEILAAQISQIVGRQIAQGTISYLTRGKSSPRTDIVVALEQLLGIPAAWWLERIESAAPSAPSLPDDSSSEEVNPPQESSSALPADDDSDDGTSRANSAA